MQDLSNIKGTKVNDARSGIELTIVGFDTRGRVRVWDDENRRSTLLSREAVVEIENHSQAMGKVSDEDRATCVCGEWNTANHRHDWLNVVELSPSAVPIELFDTGEVA